MIDLQALRNEYRAHKAAILLPLADSGTSTRGIRKTLHQLSELADRTLKTLWADAGLAHPFALLAVGGFGRGELFPYSDVDVLVLLPDDQAPEDDALLKARIEGFIGSCWDAGLEIGSSVRSVTECLNEAALDVTVQTSLLESRLITGNAELFAAFEQHFFAAVDPQAFLCSQNAGVAPAPHQV